MPSNDCLTIAPYLENAKAFRLLMVINGLIKEDSFIFPSNDLRDKYPFGLKELSDKVVPNEDTLNNANLKSNDKLDRNIVIASGISIETEKNLQEINYKVFHTEETNIFNAVYFFLKDHAAMESDYCCCP